MAKLLLMASIAAYMVYHLLQGNRGLFALFKIREIVRQEQDILTKLEHDKAVLVNNIKFLSPQSLDLDMLDERVREVLNMAGEDDIVVRFDNMECLENNS
jgi:cell division protein FtsB